MKPVIRDGNLKVELTKREVDLLNRALEIGTVLVAMHQESGPLLVDAIETVLEDGSSGKNRSDDGDEVA